LTRFRSEDIVHRGGWTTAQPGDRVMTTEKEIRALIRAVRAEMRELGVRRSSCFNGGHTPVSYRLNAEMYRLECALKDVKGMGQVG
jgi:hypothetical protein